MLNAESIWESSVIILVDCVPNAKVHWNRDRIQTFLRYLPTRDMVVFFSTLRHSYCCLICRDRNQLPDHSGVRCCLVALPIFLQLPQSHTYLVLLAIIFPGSLKNDNLKRVVSEGT